MASPNSDQNFIDILLSKPGAPASNTFVRSTRKPRDAQWLSPCQPLADNSLRTPRLFTEPFPSTLYNVNPGKNSNIIDPPSSPHSERFRDRDEV